jgi:polysaccharide biosynthesis protein PslH
MRILIISSKFPYPLKDGGAIATYTLARGLSELDNQIYILSLNTKKHFIDTRTVPQNEFRGIEFELVEINTRLNYFKALFNLAFSRQPYILERFRSHKFREALTKLLKVREFDVVQIEGLYMMQYLDLIRLNTNALISYRPHNIEHRIWELLAQNLNNQLRKIYFKHLSGRIFKFEKKVLNTYDVIIPISPLDAAFYDGQGNNRNMVVVPAGFKVSNYPLKDKIPFNKKLFYIGSLEWIPNQEGLIWFINKCWGKLKQEFPDIEFHIAGRNTPKWLISKYSKPGIFWAGEVEHIQDFIKDKAIMVVPLFSGSGMRVKIVEAFLSYKAVIASGIAVMGTGGADNCELLIADDDLEFISKISSLIRNERLYRRLVSDAYKFACINFDNILVSSDLNDLYKQKVLLKNQ